MITKLTDVIKKKIESLNSVADIPNAILTEGQTVKLVGYHAGTTVGGGDFVVKIGRHNGGTAISLTRAFPTVWGDNTGGAMDAWFADSGVDELCFVRTCDYVTLYSFGLQTGLGKPSSILINKALNTISEQGGGDLWAPYGTIFIENEEFLNVKPNVNLLGVGYGTHFVSEKGGLTSNFSLFYLKDASSIQNFRYSMSDYSASRDLIEGTPYNKIGFTTQGAVTGRNIRAKNIGSEKVIFTHAYVFDNHKDIEIDGCYTFGQQIGHYADLNGDGLITNWSVDPADSDHETKIAAGTRIYALTNFHNSGSGTADITIKNCRLYNINDSLCAPNTGAKSHKIFNNHLEKNLEGYYGGYGIDFNGCEDSSAEQNTVIGASFGVYFHDGAVGNRATGNTLKCSNGVGHDNASKNFDNNNTVVLSSFGRKSDGLGRGAGTVFSGTAARVDTSNNIRPSNIDKTIVVKTVTNATSGKFGRIKLTIPAHGMLNRNIAEITGVIGTAEANGVWSVAYVDDDNIELLGSVFSSAYVSGGQARYTSGGIGVAGVGSAGSSAIVSGGYINDLGIGMLAGDPTPIIDRGCNMSNVTEIGRGNVFLNQQVLVSGISSTANATRNLTGSVTILAGSTTTEVVFARSEGNIDYKILLSNSLQDLGLFWTNKTVNGFTLNHVSPGFNRIADWMIVG